MIRIVREESLDVRLFMKQASDGRLYMKKDHSMPFNVSTMSSFLMRLLNM